MTDHETTTALIDDALRTGRPTATEGDDRLIQELALAIRADAPAADPDFEQRLDARVESGFAAARRRPFALPAFRRPGLAALGVAASMLLALVVTVSVTDQGADDGVVLTAPAAQDGGGAAGGGETGAGAAGGGAGEAGDADTPAAAGPAPSAAAEAAKPGDEAPPTAQSEARKAEPDTALSVPGGGVAPADPVVPGRNRNVQRSALLTLAAPGEDLQAVADGVVTVTDRYRGFVMHSSVTAAEEGAAAGSFDLRVPVRNLRPALRDLSQLAEVRSRTENADDVTASFRSARTRLEELHAQRRGLLRRLARAETDIQERALRAQIRFVNEEIEAATTQLRDMRRRTSYASISVTLVADERAEGSTGGGLSDGWNDLKDNLVESGNIALRVLGVAIPLGIVAVLAWLAASAITRRRREAVLDRPAAAGTQPPAGPGPQPPAA